MFSNILRNNIYVSLFKNKKYSTLISHGLIISMITFCIYTIFKDQEIIHSIMSCTSILSLYYYFVIRIDKKSLLPVTSDQIKAEIDNIKDEYKKEFFKACLAQNINENYLTQYDFLLIKWMTGHDKEEIEKNKYYWLKKYNNKNKNEKMIKIKESLDLLENVKAEEKIKI